MERIMVFYLSAAAVAVAGMARAWLSWRALLRQLPDLPRHLVLF
jgi:hypothetical protein